MADTQDDRKVSVFPSAVWHGPDEKISSDKIICAHVRVCLLMKDSAAGLLNCLNHFQDEDFDCKDIRAHLLPATAGGQNLCS